MPDLKDIKIFISYAREDEKYLEDIKRYALRFHNTQRIEIWDDGNLSLGDEWDDEIKKHLNEADIILLFISMDFLLSDYINRTELITAIERHSNKQCTVIPIFVRYCLLDDYPQIRSLQGFPKGKFFAELKEEKDRFYVELNEAIKKEVNEIRTNASLQTTPVENKKDAEAVLQQENEQPKIRLLHSDTVLSNMMKQLFLKETEGERKHNKDWKFEVEESTYSNNIPQGINSSVFTIHIITSEADIAITANNINNSESNDQYKKSVLWISESALDEKIPAELKSNKIVVGTMSSKLIEMIYLLEKERQEFLKANKDKFSQQMNVYMLYEWNQDHNNILRINLKEKLESKSEIQTFLSPPPPKDNSLSSMQEHIHNIEQQLQLSKGAIIFYGTADANWYCYWQSEVQKIATLKSKAVCLAEPEKTIKLRRDVSRNAFIVMEDEQKLDEYMNKFINNLKMQA